MEKTDLSILIIGGGVAGMAAAQTFADKDVIVHIVEKQDRLGGITAKWACMATGSCENCGACLGFEAVEKTLKQKNIIAHLNTMVSAVNKKDGEYEVVLENQEAFNVKKIIMATGFSPFDPASLNSLHYDSHTKVITTAELNSALREETLSDYFKGKPDPKICFIQCVGSRNRELGKDYCSQVCCKISMRHATKLTHLYPEAFITLFYMDLQIIGKEARPLFNTSGKNITLVQGVPAEILEDPETGMVNIVAEDRESGSRVTKAFDLIVLSVGMQPSATLETTAGILGLTPNSWGFFNTDQAVLKEDVIIAGCARGPRDILSSQQDGRIAAARVIDSLDLASGNEMDIAVFGEGAQAETTARAISSKGYATYLFGPGTGLEKDTPITVINDGSIISVNGTAGNFSLLYQSQNKKRTLTCAAIIAANEPAQSRNTLRGLKNRPVSLDAFSRMIKESPDKCPDNSVILLDYSGPEFKSSARNALTAALKARSLGKNISIIMNKMLVHGASGQRLYDSARQQGVDFFRFEALNDISIEDSENNFLIKLKDATLPSIQLDLKCDCLVIPPAITPASGFKDLSALLRQPLDTEGFLQSANTRHRPTQSARKGLFFVGTCHDETDKDDLADEIQEVLSFLCSQPFDLPGGDPGVEIDEKKCARCLTCFRICPHSAIVINEKNKPEIVPNSCFSCHLCVSNCPAYAIESREWTNDQIAKRVEKDKVTILACERSAALAAGDLTLPGHINLVKISCACRISSDVILKALLNGASKVIVSGCHPENCRSFTGSHVAQKSVENVLSLPGVDALDVLWEPVAANEAKKMKGIIFKA